MSFTATEKHWLWGCAVATAASRSDVNVAMPHLRGKWSPTNAILRILKSSFMRQSFIPRAPRCYAHKSGRQLQMCRLSVRWEGAFSGSVDSVLRAVVFKACGLPIRCGLAGAREGYSRRCSDRLDEPAKLSLGGLLPCRARCCFTWQNHCTSHRGWRSDFVMAYLRICRWC